jgi:hypothetical protein
MTEDADVDERSRNEPATLPRWLIWLLVGVCSLEVALLLAGAWQIGITTDEPYHVQRLQHYFSVGWFLLDDDLLGAEPGSWVHDQYVYGPVAALLLHGANIVLGVEDPGTVSDRLLAYQVRHVAVALIGLAGVAATALTARRITGRRVAGLVAAVLLLANPIWTGQAMFNMKDVPVATGFTLFTYGLVLAIPEPGVGGRRRVAVVLALATGCLLAVGTRPGMWPGLAVSVVALVVLSAVSPDTRSVRGGVRWVLVQVSAGLLIGLGCLAVVYPALGDSPLAALRESVSASADYGSNGWWFYVPQQLLITFPTVLIACLALAAVQALRGLVARPRLPGRPGVAILLVLAQLTSLPTAAMLRESYLYHGLRQMLFVFPALAVLGALGFLRLASVPPGEPGSEASGRRLVTGLTIVGLLLPVLAQAQLFPYAYTYKSEGALLSGGAANDYWRASFRELTPALPADRFVVCMATDVNGRTFRYNAEVGRSPAQMSRDCRTDEIGTIESLRDWEVDPLGSPAKPFTALVPGYSVVGDNCTVTGEVLRRLLWKRQVVGRSLRCDLYLHDYPAAGLLFGPDGEGALHLLGGWTSRLDRPGVQLLDDAGSLGAVLPADLRNRDLTLRLGLDGPLREVLVDDAPVALEASGDGVLEAVVPAAVAGALGEGRLVVTVVGRAGAVTLHALELRAR